MTWLAVQEAYVHRQKKEKKDETEQEHTLYQPENTGLWSPTIALKLRNQQKVSVALIPVIPPPRILIWVSDTVNEPLSSRGLRLPAHHCPVLSAWSASQIPHAKIRTLGASSEHLFHPCILHGWKIQAPFLSPIIHFCPVILPSCCTSPTTSMFPLGSGTSRLSMKSLCRQRLPLLNA